MNSIINKEDLAPIALFVYNRPDHTKKTLEALSKNDFINDSVLYVFADGPKAGSTSIDMEPINEVRNLIKKINFSKELYLIESDKNKGLADSIVEGVTMVVNKYDKIIVLEDDIVTSPGFLTFMNEQLQYYFNESQVMHISGYMYPFTKSKNEEKVAFLNILSCWGWATWSSAWQNYTHDINLLYNSINTKKIRNKFNIEGHADYYNQLERNYNGRLYSWAVRWYASIFLNKGLSVFPATSLVKNIGFDSTGINCTKTNIFDAPTIDYLCVEKINLIKENKSIRKKIDKFYYNHLFRKTSLKESIIKLFFKGSFPSLIIEKLRKIIRITLVKIMPELKAVLEPYKSAISGNNLLGKQCKVSYPHFIQNSQIGDYTYISRNSTISNTNIGKFCSIGPNLVSGWGLHPTNGISTHPMFYSSKKQNGISLSSNDKYIENKRVNIGNDVFIGANVFVLDGVTVGDGAVIGAGTVVVKDIPPYAIVVGNPAKVIKYRFDHEVISTFLKMEWWNFNEEKIKDVERYFFEINTFIAENT